MFKKERGITLVALVVTIVVLLILAGVSISLVIGQNGIVTKAQEGASSYQNAANAERANMAGAEQELNQILENVFGTH